MPRDSEDGQMLSMPQRAPVAGNSDTAASDHIRRKNRRNRYLDLHPEYFGPQLELADPLLYDRLVRRFQTTAERELEGRKKGYSGILEADLSRGEAKMAALRDTATGSVFTYRRGKHGEILAEEKDEIPTSKAEGLQRWRWEMSMRFVQGRDDDFDYKNVDESEEYDDRGLEEHEAEEKYFDDQEPEFITGENGVQQKDPKGETGIQDF